MAMRRATPGRQQAQATKIPTMPTLCRVESPSTAAKARRCKATKLAAVGRYDACLANARARAVTKQSTPSFGRCDTQLQKKWQKAEKSAGGACPTSGDLPGVRLAATRHGTRIAEDQGGGAHFLQRLRVVHPVLAVLIAGLVVQAARRIAAKAATVGAKAAARAVVGFTAAQLALGFLNVYLSAPGWLQVTHLAFALGLWIAFVLLVREHAVVRTG